VQTVSKIAGKAIVGETKTAAGRRVVALVDNSVTVLASTARHTPSYACSTARSCPSVADSTTRTDLSRRADHPGRPRRKATRGRRRIRLDRRARVATRNRWHSNGAVRTGDGLDRPDAHAGDVSRGDARCGRRWRSDEKGLPQLTRTRNSGALTGKCPVGRRPHFGLVRRPGAGVPCPAG
jgi:hypothetical protein